MACGLWSARSLVLPVHINTRFCSLRDVVEETIWISAQSTLYFAAADHPECSAKGIKLSNSLLFSSKIALRCTVEQTIAGTLLPKIQIHNIASNTTCSSSPHAASVNLVALLLRLINQPSTYLLYRGASFFLHTPSFGLDNMFLLFQ